MTVRASSKYSDSSSRTASGVAPLGEGREPHEVGEEDRDEPALGDRRVLGRSGGPTCGPGRGRDRWPCRAAAAASSLSSRAPHSPQKRACGGLDVPQAGQAAASFGAALVAELAAGLVDGPAGGALHPRNVACGGALRRLGCRRARAAAVSRAGPGWTRPRRRTRRGAARGSPRRRRPRRARAGRSPTARAASARWPRSRRRTPRRA